MRHTMPQITVFTSNDKPLTKRFELTDAGTIKKTTLATLYAGTAQATHAPTATELDRILSSLEPLQAIATGTPKAASLVNIGTRGSLQAGRVSRSLEHFGFAPGPGWLLWDYDDKTMPDDVAERVAALGGPVDALFHIWPEAKNASYVIRPSSSDGIVSPDGQATKSAGLHGFFLIDDASKSKDALNALQERAWAQGLAWITLSKSGAQLVRSIVDVAVGSPERLIFEAGPILQPPLTRKSRSSIVQDGKPPIATPALAPDLLSIATTAQAQARTAIAPEAAKVEGEFIKHRARDLSHKTGTTFDAALQTIKQMMRGAMLADDHLLQINSGLEVRVGDILDNPDAYHRKGIPDPIEGLEYGADKATLLLKPREGRPHEKPRLVSHAHGARTVYTFARYEAKPPTPPVYPMPEGDRGETIQKIGDTIHQWGRRSDLQAQAKRRVAARYAEIDDLDPNRTALQRQARKDVKRELGLDYLPAASWTKATPTERQLISGAQGVGKTAAVVGSDHGDASRPGILQMGRGYVSAFFSPDHGKSAEALADYEKHATPLDPIAVQALGRTAPHPTKPDHKACELSEQTRRAANRGVNVQSAFCQKCPFAETCAYLEQATKIKAAANDPRGAVVFAVHDHAFAQMPGGVEPDRFIFDERTRDMGFRETFVFKEDWGRDIRGFADWSAQSAGQTADQLADLLALINPLRNSIARAIWESTETALELITAAASQLADEGETPGDVIRKAAARLKAFDDDVLQTRIANEIEAFALSQAAGTRTRSLTSRLDSLIDDAEEKTVRGLIAVFQAIATEVEQGHGPGLTGVQKGTRNGKPGIIAGWIDRANIPENAPLLHIDGTANADLASAWFGPLNETRLRVDRLLEEAVFVEGDRGNTFATSAFTGFNPHTGKPVFADRAEVLRGKVRKIIDSQPGGFVAAPLPVLNALGDMPDHITGHYGALRGRNMAKDCETGIVIGRNLPRVRDVEKIARAFAVAINRPFEKLPEPKQNEPDLWPRRDEGLRMADNTAHPVSVEYHPDETAQAVLRQIRDAEATQAIDRVRAMFTPKRLIFISASLPDVTFTKVAKLDDMAKGGTRLERIAKRGVITLSRSETLRLFPDVYSSKSVISRDTEYQGLTGQIGRDLLVFQHVLKNYLVHNGTLKEIAVLARYKCRPKGTGRGAATQQHTAIVFAPAHQARDKLEALTGGLEAFEVLDMTPEAERIDLAIHRQALRDADTVESAEIVEIHPQSPTRHRTGETIAPERITAATGPPSG